MLQIDEKIIGNITWTLTLDGFDFVTFKKDTEIETKEAQALESMTVKDFIQMFTGLRVELCCFKHEKSGEKWFTKCPLRPNNMSCGHIRTVLRKFLIAIAIGTEKGTITPHERVSYLARLEDAAPLHDRADKEAFQGYDEELGEWISYGTIRRSGQIFIGPLLQWRTEWKFLKKQAELGTNMARLKKEILEKLAA